MKTTTEHLDGCLPCRMCGSDENHYEVTESWAGNLNFYDGWMVCLRCRFRVQAWGTDGVADRDSARERWNLRTWQEDEQWIKEKRRPLVERQAFMAERDNEWYSSDHKCFGCGIAASGEQIQAGFGSSWDLYSDSPVWLCGRKECERKWMSQRRSSRQTVEESAGTT